MPRIHRGCFVSLSTLAGRASHTPLLALAALLLSSAICNGAQAQMTAEAVSTNVGSANVCPSGSSTPAPCSQSATISFTVAAGTTIGSVNVVTQGAPNLDFIATTPDTSATLCTAQTYSGATTCTVDVTFAPRYPGQRMGAVVIRDPQNYILAKTLLYGTGVAPQVDFYPQGLNYGTQGTYSPLFQNSASAIALDASGNIFVENSALDQIQKWTPGSGGYSLTTIARIESAQTSTCAPGIAVDGVGTVYYLDCGAHELYEAKPLGAGYRILGIRKGVWVYPTGVGIDQQGNVYVLDGYRRKVFEESPRGEDFTQSYIDVTTLDRLTGIAVDPQGDIFLSSWSNPSYSSLIVEEPTTGGAYTQQYIGDFAFVNSLATDAVGNLYLLASNHSDHIIDFYRVGSAGGAWSVEKLFQQTAREFAIAFVQFAVDGSGNMIGIDPGSGYVVEYAFAEPPSVYIAGPPYLPGESSEGKNYSILVQNQGNAPLTFPALASANNPSSNNVDFSLDSSSDGDCTEVLSSSSPATLAPGASCLLEPVFAPRNDRVWQDRRVDPADRQLPQCQLCSADRSGRSLR